jgi:hypothetical protein
MEETFVEVSLPPGDYRSRVISFDVLGRQGSASAWQYFTVVPAPPVELPDISAGRPERKNPALFTGLSFAPLVPLPFSEFNERYRGSFQPWGASLRLAVFPFGNSAGTTHGQGRSVLGFEFNPSWNYLFRKTAAYTASNQLASLHANLLWKLWLKEESLALNFRLGGGLAFIWNLTMDYTGNAQKEKISTWLSSAALSVSLQYCITENFSVDVGAEYFHLFSVDNPFLNFIRPYAGIVWRWN